MTTSRLPDNYAHQFTKDTLEGDYHGFRREIWSHCAYETRENAVGAVMLMFALIDDHSAITASIWTDIYLPETIERWEDSSIQHLRSHSMGGIVDFHWDFPIEGVEPREDCTMLPGKCWSIGTATLDEQILEALAREGFDGVWHDLHEILVDQTKVQRGESE